MLPKSQRLPLRVEPDFFQKSKRWYSPLFTVFWQVTSPKVMQAAVVVPKKVAPRAVDRNKLKRVFRHMLQEHASVLMNIELVISPKKAALTTAHIQITQEFTRFINQITDAHQK